jgi:hypothetical protein
MILVSMKPDAVQLAELEPIKSKLEASFAEDSQNGYVQMI